MPDITYNCVDCKEDFTFTEGEQDYFTDRGLAVPKRCSKCRLKRRSGLGRHSIEILTPEPKLDEVIVPKELPKDKKVK